MGNSKIIGSATCPLCSITGHDADSCRANLGEDGRVSCITCGRINTPLPQVAQQLPLAIRQLLVRLGSTDDVNQPVYRVLHVNNKLDEPGELRETALVAHDVDVSVLDVTRIVLSADEHNFDTISIRFTPADLKMAARAHGKQPVIDERKSRLPKHVVQALNTLIGDGFRITNPDAGGTASQVVLLRKGDTTNAIHVELTRIL